MTAPETNTNARSSYYSTDRLALRLFLRRYLQLVSRRWLIVVLLTALGLGIGLARALTSPDIYRASSVLRIAPRVQTGFTSQAQYQEVLDKYYENQLYDMQSAAVLDRVVARVGESYKGPSPVPSANRRALRGQGSFFQMVVDHPDFDYAKLFAEVWAQEFVNFKNRLKSDAFDRTARATRDEVIRYDEKLTSVRKEIQDFKRRHDIANIRETLTAAQELLNQLVAEQTRFSTLRQLLENTTKEAIASGALIDNQLAVPEKAGGERPPARADTTDPLAKFNTAGSKYRDLMARLRGREAERERWSSILRPKHDFMAALELEIVRMQRDLQIELSLIEESRLALLASYRQNERSYEPLIRKQNEIVLNSSSIQHEFNKLTEEEGVVGKQLADLRRSLAELDLTLSSNEEDLTISEKGAGVRVPVSPNRPRIILIGLVIGLLGGVGLAYVLHRLDDRLDLAEDVERELEEPILGQVPLVPMREVGRGRLLITDLPQHDMFSESIRGVRSSVLLSSTSKGPQVLVVTSAVPGDGKTTFTANFAATLATMNQRVLLVDLDLRRGATHTLFRLDREPGLSAVLEGRLPWRDAVRPTEIPNLDILTTGALPSDPGELVLQPQTRSFVEEARTVYDCVILDTPPLISINDTFALLPFCDGVLFVVRAGQTSMKLARTAIEAVRRRSAPILGLILNGITPDNPYYYYQHYYHAYYTDEGADADAKKARGGGRSGRRVAAVLPANSIAAQAQNLHRVEGEPPAPPPDPARVEAFKKRRSARQDESDD